jgi:MoxR-like ATPase
MTAGADPSTRDHLQRIVDAWSRGKGALLYGPPGTGKTRILGQLHALLADPDGLPAVTVDPADAVTPFAVTPVELPIPRPVRTDWLTFHQSLSYEDFIFGLRPQSAAGGGLNLVPRLGRLLDGAYHVSDVESETASAVFFIDEVNRGNTARIFGEFITFLDADYRATRGGADNALKLPVPLAALAVDPRTGRTERVERPSGGTVTLPVPWYFPEHLYVVATMNSVDRAAVPLDSALARRFERIELRPDPGALAAALGLDWDELLTVAAAARASESGAYRELTAGQATVLLLDRLNHALANDLGDEFELGHGLLWPVADAEPADRWAALARTWDDVVLPQLEDRYAGRPDQMTALLKLGGDTPPDYAFTVRAPLGAPAADEGSARTAVRLAAIDPARARRTLQWLAV